MHLDDSGGVVLELLVVMSDHDHQLVRGYLREKLYDALGGIAVEVARRLVGDQYACVLCESSCDGDTLLLSTRKPRDFAPCEFCEAHLLDDLRHFLLYLFVASAIDLHRKRHVLVHGVAGYQVEVLEDAGYVFLSVFLEIRGGVVACLLAFDVHLALFIGVEARDDVEERGLAAARLACYYNKFAHVKIEVDPRDSARDYPLVVIVFRNVF